MIVNLSYNATFIIVEVIILEYLSLDYKKRIQIICLLLINLLKIKMNK